MTMRLAAIPLVATCLLVAAGTATAAEPAADLKTATDHLQHGRYSDAKVVFTSLADAGDAEQRPRALLGLVDCLLAEGELEQAEQRLTAGVDQLPESAAIRARLAQYDFVRGRYADARKHADAALTRDGENLRARLVRARVKIELGDHATAAEDFRWFVQYYNRRQPKDAEALLLIAEGAAEYARARSVGQVFSFIVNELAPDALKVDANAWQSYLISGSLLLEKYNNAQAKKEFERGLEINSRSADLLVGMARSALDERDSERARELALRALGVNRRHHDALLLLTDLAFAAGQLDEVGPLLDRAVDVNPRSQRALARKAGLDLLQNGVPSPGLTLEMVQDPAGVLKSGVDREFLKIIQGVVEQNPAPGQFLTDLGEVLEQARRYDAATTCYARAIDVAPLLSAPRTALGLLQMRTGDLASARRILDDAFRADRFHVRVSNMRKVLDVLERYETMSTDHFILRFDASDRVFASYLAEELEDLYGPLTKEFGFEPPDRTAFEIFSAAKGESGHSWFSARMTGMPWIQTIGASTGHIVALSSPTSREPYNWARVVKHEFCHVVTLQQTNFGIPHWYTEALAVRTEGDVFPETWRRLLIDRREKGTLFTLETVNNGFQRPKNGDDWQHAYCMSRLYARYMEETYGSDSLLKLVAAYRDGKKTPAAIRQVFGVSLGEFEAGFRTFLDSVIDELNAGKVPRGPSLAQAEASLKERPDDVEQQAAVAWAILNDAPPSRAGEAVTLANAILEKSPDHPFALAVLARVDLRNRRAKAAREKLERGFNADSPHPAVVAILGRMAFDDKDYATSARVFSAGLKAYPKELGFTYLLAMSLLKLDRPERLPELFEVVAARDFDDLTSRRWLLGHAVKNERWDDAIRWGREAMQIDVRDGTTHRELGRAYAKSGNLDRARRHLATALELDPGDKDAKSLLQSLP